ncbi:hypothetical protein OIU85_005094 [Salix viminalis]|uniref:Uncharacterized protein n=1 Tax=Salix viminalis TaxID=40686 RepID=A0A9Q0PTW6_SALVM|nr:hypothetical protein OIU85_005094 [Salix viminalis]
MIVMLGSDEKRGPRRCGDGARGWAQVHTQVHEGAGLIASTGGTEDTRQSPGVCKYKSALVEKWLYLQEKCTFIFSPMKNRGFGVTRRPAEQMVASVQPESSQFFTPSARKLIGEQRRSALPTRLGHLSEKDAHAEGSVYSAAANASHN